MQIEPFTIAVPDPVLEDLRDRLSRTRWPDEVAGAGWDYGSNLAYMQELVRYWRDRFDWKAIETRLNAFHHFRATVDGFGIHYIHERGKGRDPFPVMLLHGWPGSFLQMEKIIPMLTDPARYGGGPSDAFDVVVPSLPGYGFSDRPTEKGMSISRIAGIFSRLVRDGLGWQRFGLRVSDLGTGVAMGMTRRLPRNVAGLHLSGATPPFSPPPGPLTEAEQAYLETSRILLQDEGGYAAIQATRPQTLAYGLNDSTAGLAAWIVEKFRKWSDSGGDVERRFSRDELLTTSRSTG